MSESDLETSIECSRKFFTLPLDLTSDSLIDSVPFDSSSDHENEHNEDDFQARTNNHENKEKGKDSFSLASYMLSLHQPSESSLQGIDLDREVSLLEHSTNTSLGYSPTPLGTQIHNHIISAYSEPEDSREVVSQH